MINDQPLVTIAIPTYNRADNYLPSALRSALRQTYSNIEIVVSDNCSTDHTQALVRGIGDPRIRYFRHDPGIGQKNNYNFCFEQAKEATYFCYMMMTSLMKILSRHACTLPEAAAEVGIVRTGMRTINADGDIIDQVTNDVVGLPLEAFFRCWFAGKTPDLLLQYIIQHSQIEGDRRVHIETLLLSGHNGYFSSRSSISDGSIYPRSKQVFVFTADQAGFSRRISEWCEDSLDLLHLMCDLAPQSREQILKEGARFFARGNYNRASCAIRRGNVRSPL